MRIVVFGAAGRTGRLIVERALGHGHEVTAVIHATMPDTPDPRLITVFGDVREFGAVEAAVTGQHAVAFALSHGADRGSDILEAGIANVVHAMAAQDVRRLAAVSAGGAFARTDKRLSLAFRALIATAMRPVYDDLEAMERRIMASALDWTIVRPAALSDEPASGQYRISLDGSLLPKAGRISRADVASVVVKAIETDTYLLRAVVIAE